MSSFLGGIGQTIDGITSNAFNGFASNVTQAAALLDPQAAHLFFTADRFIGSIIPGITIEESHTDPMVITEHPVEIGAAISDHVYKRPPQFTMRVKWSNSDNAAILDFGESYAKTVYNELLTLQASLQTFTVSTGKRLHQNVLMAELVEHTDARTEYALDCSITFQEVIIVSTALVALPAQDPSTQADPASTAGTADTGSKIAAPSDGGESVLHKLTGTTVDPSQALQSGLSWITGGAL